MFQGNRKIWFWAILGICFFAFLHLISSILLPFVAGMMIAYFLDPAADWLERKGCSRLTATSILVCGFFSILTLSLVALSPILYDQFLGLMKAMPRYIEKLREYAGPQIENVMQSVTGPGGTNDAKQAVTKASGTLFDVATNFITGLFASGMAMVNLITLLFLTPVVAFYLLRDFDVMVAHIDGLLPRESASTIRTQVREMDRTIAAYLRGQVNVCILLALFYAVGLSLTGLNYGILVGIISGLISFIPFVGALLGFVVAGLIAIFQFDDTMRILLVVGVYGIGQFLEGNILVPKLIGGKVGLHPAWVIFGMLAGGAILGFVGVLLAVPISAIIGVLVRFATQQYRDSVLYQGDDEHPYVPPMQHVLTQKKREQLKRKHKKAMENAKEAAGTTPAKTTPKKTASKVKKAAKPKAKPNTASEDMQSETQETLPHTPPKKPSA
ncbi:MAG: AI-2E family transporter [Alphaproteobacteria bacterium]|nr:AI-2E family transporter [Alphaproteobacteria bacterium]